MSSEDDELSLTESSGLEEEDDDASDQDEDDSGDDDGSGGDDESDQDDDGSVSDDESEESRERTRPDEALEAKLRAEFADVALVSEIVNEAELDTRSRKTLLQFVMPRICVAPQCPKVDAETQAFKRQVFVMKCRNGHATFKTSRYFNCDVCGTACIKDFAYFCSSCDWDCCMRCYRAHAQEAEQKVREFREERRTLVSGPWRPQTGVYFQRSAEEGLLKELHENADDRAMVRLLCQALWQLRLSHSKALNAEEAKMVIELGKYHLDDETVTAAVLGLLSNASKALRGTGVGKEIVDHAYSCLRTFPKSDYVAEFSIKLLFMFDWVEEEERLRGISRIAAIRFGVGVN